MSASRVWLSTVVRPMNQERSMTMRRMPFSRTTTGASSRSWGRRRTLYQHGSVLGRRAVSTLCALLLLAGGAARAAAQTPPPPVTPTSPVSSSAVAADVMAFDPQVVSGAPAGLGEEHLEDAGTAGEIVEFYGYDAIGSVRMVFDPAGTVVGEATYSPFGIELAGTTGMPSQRFTGQERDHEAQLDYFNARSLQARTGRFASPDPVWGSAADPQRWNRYAYALNSPLMMTDTTGLKADFSMTVVGCESCVGMLYETMMSYYFRGLFGGGEGGTSGGDYYNSGNYSGPTNLRPVTTPLPGPTCPGDPSCPTLPPSPTPPPTPTPTEDGKSPGSMMDTCLINAGNFAAGFGDTLTSGFGLTDLLGLPSGTAYARQLLGWDDVVQRESAAYGGGAVGGEVWGMAAGGAGLARKLGHEVMFAYYKHGRGIGVTLKSGGKRVFGLDWHRFNYKGVTVNRPHYHCGPTKSQINKHKPWQ